MKFLQNAESEPGGKFHSRLLKAQLEGLKLLVDVLDGYDEKSEDDFANVIRVVIESRFNPSELAAKFKVSISTISRWKDRKSCPPSYARKVIVSEIKSMIVSSFTEKSAHLHLIPSEAT